jgi:hypothetical protein
VKLSPRRTTRGAIVALIVVIVLSIGTIAVTVGPQAFIRSVPIRFDWDHAKGFNAISVKVPLPLPFYNTVLSRQARPWIASLFQKAGWRSAQGTLSVRVCFYYVVLGLDRQSDDASEIIDPETTPLMHAAEVGNATDVQRLIAEGADVNARDQRGWTALMHAAMKDRARETELLLAAGANPNVRDSDGRTAMLWSARSCAPDVADVFARWGASFNTRDKYGDTPSNYVSMCPGLARAVNARPAPE